MWKSYKELYDIPLIFNERSPVLGNTGDLVLADLSHYVVKDGSGPLIEISEHHESHYRI